MHPDQFFKALGDLTRLLVVLYFYQLGWSFTEVGGFMALWVIGYGLGLSEPGSGRLLVVVDGFCAGRRAVVIQAAPSGVGHRDRVKFGDLRSRTVLPRLVPDQRSWAGSSPQASGQSPR